MLNRGFADDPHGDFILFHPAGKIIDGRVLGCPLSDKPEKQHKKGDGNIWKPRKKQIGRNTHGAINAGFNMFQWENQL